MNIRNVIFDLIQNKRKRIEYLIAKITYIEGQIHLLNKMFDEDFSKMDSENAKDMFLLLKEILDEENTSQD